jgi:hypothetical protein
MIFDRPKLARCVLFLAAGVGGCASQPSYIAGTHVLDNERNRNLIRVCEQYRVAVEKKDVTTLVSLASRNYWEDGGTPTGSDDYGYDGLREVLQSRFNRADGIRYTMKYMDVKPQAANRAGVDVMIDASYSITTAHGPQRLDMRDQNEMVLEWDGKRWLFLSGM